MKLSLIVAYRKRPQHLAVTLTWFKKTVELNHQIELILVESDENPEIDPLILKHPSIKYHFEKSEDVFNKSKLLNIGLKMSEGEFVIPYDIDNVPCDISFSTYFKLMNYNESFLFGGYRIMSKKRFVEYTEVNNEIPLCELSPEDSAEKFLKLQLTSNERFGIHPLFSKKIINEINGWDEKYEGWGAEDNDIIYRYLEHSGTLFMKSQDLIFLHQYHDKTPGWNEIFYTQNNLKYYYSKKGIELDC